MAENSRQFLDIVFHPKSIAIVGASAEEKTVSWVKSLLDFGYPATLYPVNPKVAEINGLKAYPSVRDIPRPVDYAIFSISARRIPQAMEDCVAKGVKIVHIYTAGFSETGREEGRQLEKRVAAIAKEGGVRVIGPNGMGIYYPEGGMTYGIGPLFPRESGNISVVSQTGTGIG